MNRRIMTVFNALAMIKLRRNDKRRVEKLRTLVGDLTEEEWATIRFELPDEYILLKAYKKIKTKGVSKCEAKQLNLLIHN